MKQARASPLPMTKLPPWRRSSDTSAAIFPASFSSSPNFLLQGASSVQRLYFVDIELVLNFAWADANLAGLTWHAGKAMKLPNQSQQNIASDLMGRPVLKVCLWLKRIRRITYRSPQTASTCRLPRALWHRLLLPNSTSEPWNRRILQRRQELSRLWWWRPVWMKQIS